MSILTNIPRPNWEICCVNATTASGDSSILASALSVEGTFNNFDREFWHRTAKNFVRKKSYWLSIAKSSTWNGKGFFLKCATRILEIKRRTLLVIRLTRIAFETLPISSQGMCIRNKVHEKPRMSKGRAKVRFDFSNNSPTCKIRRGLIESLLIEWR